MVTDWYEGDVSVGCERGVELLTCADVDAVDAEYVGVESEGRSMSLNATTGFKGGCCWLWTLLKWTLEKDGACSTGPASPRTSYW
jgi:hypothetical protein